MTTPLEVRAAAIARFKAAFPKLRECTDHPDRFDLDEIKRWLTQVPSIRVAWLGITRFEDDGAGFVDAECRFAAFVAADSTAGLKGSDAAAAIVTALVPLIDRADWGFDDVGPAALIAADNLHGAAGDAAGTALWALSWRQSVRLGADLFAAGGLVPAHWYAGTGGRYEEVAADAG